MLCYFFHFVSWISLMCSYSISTRLRQLRRPQKSNRSPQQMSRRLAELRQTGAMKTFWLTFTELATLPNESKGASRVFSVSSLQTLIRALSTATSSARVVGCSSSLSSLSSRFFMF
ncbi:hypothetical protein DFH11DRAFT_1602409 [Phellopilus nigrolimitatus]|nr:hypothetical protein DFH11DRAFT_1602409 [Phellopilus nigrolimitatus]